MKSYVVLMRGINVGGKNKIPMAVLKQILDENGFEEVMTYIQSGNVILRSNLEPEVLAARIEEVLPGNFALDGSVKIVAFEHHTYKDIVANAPRVFGSDPDHYRDNVLFLMGYSPEQAMEQVDPREGVDQVWAGRNALYFRNSKADASKSHLSRIVQKPMYQFVTIRNWNTTRKLLELLEGQQS